MLRYLSLFLLSCGLIACSSNPAPVIDRTPAAKSKPVLVKPSSKAGSDWRPDTHTVKKGDTLFSIGLEYGYDYKDIAQANNIGAPYTIKIGQVLKLGSLKDKAETAETQPAKEADNGVVTYPIDSGTSPSPVDSTTAAPAVVDISEPKAIREIYSIEAFKAPLPTAKPATAVTAKPAPDKTVTAAKAATKPAEVKTDPKPATKPNATVDAKPGNSMNWAWPAKGKIIANFNDGGNKGIDIAGSKGQPIQAAESGKVIYSGSDLRGYGKMVIVKHSNTYLSVYANNNAILVKEGQQVKRGQKIAEMGDTDSNTVKLHFEIRQQGKSVDPTKFLAEN